MKVQVLTLQNSSSTNYACVNVDGISFTNINSDYSQNLRINFITGPLLIVGHHL